MEWNFGRIIFKKKDVAGEQYDDMGYGAWVLSAAAPAKNPSRNNN
jgi:hypothetical protein